MLSSELIQYITGITDRRDILTWAETTLQNYMEKTPLTVTQIEHIIDYLASDKAPARISRMSVPEALQATEKWTNALQKKGEHIKEKKEDTKVVLDFKDGFKIVQLIGKSAYEREGYLMRHCVSDYFGKDDEIYSLRDKKNMPHCTMSKNSQQVKGKGNGSIHPLYIEYVVKFLEYAGMTVRDNEMKNLGYINMEKFKNELHKDTNYFHGKYLPQNEKLIGVDGKEFQSLDLLDVKELVTENNNSLKINFDLPPFIKLSLDYLWSSIKKESCNGSITDKDSAKNASSGDYATNASSGDYAKNASSGDSAKNASSGHSATNEMLGKHSVSVDAGHNGKAKGKIGSWFCLSEWKEDKELGKWIPACVKAVQIDGKKIKEDTWYSLKDSEFVEA